jgi:hypothetical protein
MGAVLLAAGAKGKRFALPHSRIMIHQPLGGFQGQAADIAIQAREILRMREDLNNILMKHTGQSLKKRKRYDHDLFMNGASPGIRWDKIAAHRKRPQKEKPKRGSCQSTVRLGTLLLFLRKSQDVQS